MIDIVYTLVLCGSHSFLSANARELQVSTRSFGLETEVVVPGEEAENLDGGRSLAYLPNFNTSYIIWYQRHWMRVTRTKQTGPYGRPHETLELK